MTYNLLLYFISIYIVYLLFFCYDEIDARDIYYTQNMIKGYEREYSIPIKSYFLISYLSAVYSIGGIIVLLEVLLFNK